MSLNNNVQRVPGGLGRVLMIRNFSQATSGNNLYYSRKSDLMPSAEFFTRDPDNARRLFSTYLITDLRKYVKELLQLHGKSSMIMNCPKKDPFCHYIEDELIV